MDYKVIENFDEGLKYFEKFNVKDCLWDLTEVSLSQFDEKYHKIYFIVLIDNEIEVGLVPLVFDINENKYYYFCGFHPENRKFLFEPKYFKYLYDILPTPVSLIDFNTINCKEMVNEDEFEKYFNDKDKHYFLDLKNIDYSFDKFLERFTSKHKKNLKYDLKKVEEKNYTYLWEKLENYDYLVKFNTARFGKESDYDDSDFVAKSKALFDVLDSFGNIQTLFVKDQDKVIGIEIGVIHNNIYYVINGGYDRSYKNLGKMIMYKHIMNAIKYKCIKIDFLVGDGGWKELWNLDYEYYYTLRKK